MEKKRFGAFLKHFSLAQNTLKSYHKWPKSRFNLQGTVMGFYAQFDIMNVNDQYLRVLLLQLQFRHFIFLSEE